MKKLLLGLGSIASVVAPIAAVISCGDDDKNTNAGTQAKTYTITGHALDEVKAGLTAALAIPTADVETVVTGDNFSSGSFHVDHYTKVTFNKDTNMDYGSTTPLKAGDVLVMGTDDARRRATASAAPAIKMYVVRVAGVGEELTVDASKQTLLQKGVISKVIEFVQSQQPAGGNGSTGAATVTPVPATIDPSDATKINVGAMIVQAGLTTLPTTLTSREISPVMDSIKALSNVNTATTIEFILTGQNTSDLTASGTIPGVRFTINITAGKAGNLADVVAAASSVTGVPATDGSGSTGGGSGSTGGTTAIDLGAERAKFDDNFTSTMTKAQIATALNGMAANTAIADPATTLGITLPTVPTGVTVAFKLQQAFTGSSSEALITATLSASGMTDTSAIMHVQPAVSLTQSDFDTWTAPVGFTTQTTMLSESSLKAKITAGSITLNNLGLAALATPPNGTQASDFTVALAVDTTIGTAGWAGGKLALKATITYTPASLTKVVDVLVTPTAPVDLAGLTSAFWTSIIADVKSPATDEEVVTTAGSSAKPAHFDNMTAQELTTLFNKANENTLTFHGGATTSDNKEYELKYSMTAPTSGAKGPFTITVTATPKDGSEAIKNTKTFDVTTTMKVEVDHDYLEADTTTTTQLNVGKAGKVVIIDRTAPSAATGITAEFIDPIVAAIVDGTSHGSAALQGSIVAATTLKITFNDGTADHTLTTGAFAPGEATDAAKVLAAAQAGTLT